MPVVDRPVRNDWPHDYGIKKLDALARVRQALKDCTPEQRLQMAAEILDGHRVHVFANYQSWRRLESFRLASWIEAWTRR